jgi:hypothetical protein
MRVQALFASRKGSQMTIRFENLNAGLLTSPRVKAEYDALAPEFEIAAKPRAQPF